MHHASGPTSFRPCFTILCAGLCLCVSAGATACDNDHRPGAQDWQDAVVIFDGAHRPIAVAADDAWIYWAEITTVTPETNRIFRVARTGGATELLHAQIGGILDLAVDSDGLYFLEGAALNRMDHGGGAVTTLHEEGNGESLVLHGGRLFWWSRDSAEAVYSVRTDGADPIEHYAGRVGGRLAVDDTHVYLASGSSGQILAQPWPGAADPVVVGEDTCPTDLALGPDHVYWLSPATCGVTGGEALWRAPRAALADPSAAETVHDAAYGLVGSGVEVLFTDSRELWRVTTGSPVKIASVRNLTCKTGGPVVNCSGPTDLFLDPTGLFLCGWSGMEGGTGSLGFVARP